MSEETKRDEGYAVTKRGGNAITDVSAAREVQEVQAAVAIAKRYPRDEKAALDRILNACTRPGLAEAAVYQYARGGTDVTGPSIRMAEALAQNWGNLQFGIRELEQRDGESTVEAFAWDLETNTRQCKVFQVKHVRGTKQGNKALTDPRDIYEMVANNGARRVRACILGVIPGDVIEAAMKQCETTLHAKAEVTPERIKGLLEKFAAYKVTKAQIEGRIQRRIESMTAGQLVSLGKVYNSLKDGVSTVADWFETEQQAKTARRGASPLASVVMPTEPANAQDVAEAAAEPAPAGDLSDLPL